MPNIKNFIKKIISLSLTANTIYKSAQITFFVIELALELNQDLLDLDLEKDQILEVSSSAAILSLFMDLWQNNRFDEIQILQNILPYIKSLIQKIVPNPELINEINNYVLRNFEEITTLFNQNQI